MSTTFSNPAAVPNAFARSAAKYQDMAARLGFYLLMLVGCCSPWGDVLRFGYSPGPSDRGPTTIFALGVIAISLVSFKFIAAIAMRPRVLFFAGFVVIGILASVVQNLSFVESLGAGINRGGYWALMVAVMSLNLSSEKGRTFVRWFALSTTLMSIVALIDYYNIVNVPGFNEIYSGFRLEPEREGGLVGRSLIGPFASRSILGPYLALAWVVPLMELLQGTLKKPVHLAVWASSLAVLTLAILVSYSRALYLTIVFGSLYAIYVTGRRKILQIAFVVVPLGLVFFLAVQTFLPHEMAVLTNRLASLSPDRVVESGGHYRINSLMITLNDNLNNPLGMGFGRVTLGREQLVVHSVITEHIRPAGFVGFIFTLLFLWPILKMIASRRSSPGAIVLCASLVGALAYGIAHSTHNMLGAWIVIGLLYRLSTEEATKKTSNATLVPAAEARGTMRRRR